MQPIQTECVKLARSKGYLPHKMNSLIEIGWPDYLFMGDAGRTIFVEFKRPGEAVRPWQQRKIRKLRKRGHEAYLIDNVKDFKVLIGMGTDA